MEFVYQCVTRCIFKNREWLPGEKFVTSDPADIPPHHFEGGINPKNTAAVQGLINERLGVPEAAPEEPTEPSEPTEPTELAQPAQPAQPTGRGRRG